MINTSKIFFILGECYKCDKWQPLKFLVRKGSTKFYKCAVCGANVIP